VPAHARAGPLLTRAPLRSLSPVLDPLISGTTERIGAQGEAGDHRASRACWAGGPASRSSPGDCGRGGGRQLERSICRNKRKWRHRSEPFKVVLGRAADRSFGRWGWRSSRSRHGVPDGTDPVVGGRITTPEAHPRSGPSETERSGPWWRTVVSYHVPALGSARTIIWGRCAGSNKAMKLTKLSPAPWPVGGAGSCPRWTIIDAGTASQLIASVRQTLRKARTRRLVRVMETHQRERMEARACGAIWILCAGLRSPWRWQMAQRRSSKRRVRSTA
jgi:hypothetical protein